VSIANHIPFAAEPVVISVGKGAFVTHLNFPDQPYPEKSLTIAGRSPGATKLSAAGSGTVLIAFADAPPITIQDLTISGGTGTKNTGGGAVHDGGNIMSFYHVTFAKNSDSMSPASGGAIDDDAGTMTITDSIFEKNTAGSSSSSGTGGAVSEQGGSLTVSGSLITGNTVQKAGVGGAVYVNDGHLKILDSTITANSAPGVGTGGAIGLDQVAHTVVVGSTINGNTAGGTGGLVASTGGSAISFAGNVLVANHGAGGSACAGGGVTDVGYNVIDSTGCSMGGKSSIKSALDVGLRQLAANGGLTETERILNTSAAHDMVPRAATLAGTRFCAGHDQRGVPRQQGPTSRCDAGAYQYAPPVITGISPKRGAPGTVVTIRGYGFDFLSLRFRSLSLAFVVHAYIRIIVVTPKLSRGQTSIKLSNPDGQATASFQVLRPPKRHG
jgi:hypothetical protein